MKIPYDQVKRISVKTPLTRIVLTNNQIIDINPEFVLDLLVCEDVGDIVLEISLPDEMLRR